MIRPLLVALVLSPLPSVLRAESVRLAEDRSPDRVVATDVALRVDGKLLTPDLAGTKSLKLKVRAAHEFRARPLPPAGRDAMALRSLRRYDAAEAEIVVETNTSTSDLASDRRTFVADGRPDGVRFHAPDFLLTTSEIDLLDTAADPLGVVALLPGDDREVGDTWNVPHWGAQMLAGLEALEKAEVECLLKSVAGSTARVNFSGTIVGGHRGARVELEIEGHYLFDVDDALLTHAELKQTDKRTIGPVSPGVEVTASVTIDRRETTDDRGITTAYASTLPLEAEPRSLLVSHPLPWNAELRLDRSWYLFHQTSRVALLRRMRSGTLVAQCNVSRIEPAAPGRHLSTDRFADDVRTALGDQMEKIEQQGEIDTGDDRYAYRVTAVGNNVVGTGEDAKAVPMHWIYYLLASPTGRQLSFVFVVESELLPQLGGADEAIVRASRFVESNTPTRAASRER